MARSWSSADKGVAKHFILKDLFRIGSEGLRRPVIKSAGVLAWS